MLRKAVSVLLTLLLSIVCAPAQALTEADLRTVVLENHAYVLGESTLAHFVQDGRSSYTIEADGTVRLPYQNGCLYLQLLDSSANPLSQPVVAMDLQWTAFPTPIAALARRIPGKRCKACLPPMKPRRAT